MNVMMGKLSVVFLVSRRCCFGEASCTFAQCSIRGFECNCDYFLIITVTNLQLEIYNQKEKLLCHML